MTVEDYLRGKVMGLELSDNAIEISALSPIDVGLAALDSEDDVDEESYAEEEFRMRLDYATSTLYYLVLGVFAGGGYSEQVGDVRVSKGGYTITMADRARYKALADALRQKWGFEVEDDASSGGAYDASYQRYMR